MIAAPRLAPIASPTPLPDDDHAALAACAAPGVALCTVVRIDGSWSRRLGAQLAVRPDGSTCGSLADGCLERALAVEALSGAPARVLRYGQGSPFVDIRLPCGSGVEVAIDPAPDRAAIHAALAALEDRRVADLAVPTGASGDGAPFLRRYVPRLRLIAAGSGAELAALATLAQGAGIATCTAAPLGEDSDVPLALGRAPDQAPDAYTAIAILFHDHEWEQTLIPWALRSAAFYVGAQGGARIRASRLAHIAALGLTPAAAQRLHSPIGLIPAARTPTVLALSVLAEVVGAYEAVVAQTLGTPVAAITQ